MIGATVDETMVGNKVGRTDSTEFRMVEMGATTEGTVDETGLSPERLNVVRPKARSRCWSMLYRTLKRTESLRYRKKDTQVSKLHFVMGMLTVSSFRPRGKAPSMKPHPSLRTQRLNSPMQRSEKIRLCRQKQMLLWSVLSIQSPV